MTLATVQKVRFQCLWYFAVDDIAYMHRGGPPALSIQHDRTSYNHGGGKPTSKPANFK
jgi:hypothetical protein